MVDRIDGPTPGRTAKVDSAKPQSATTAGSAVPEDVNPVAAPRPDSDTLQTSLVKKAENEIAATSEVDRQQVQRIKEAIGRGEYVIDPNKVAKAFIELEALLGR